jgi:tRNA nucleotidyltransferase (CCA-adding enzyme)
MDIKPTSSQRDRIIKFSDNLMKIILDYANSLNLDVECKLVGSMAKKTSLKSKADIDIFMTFPLDYSEEKLKEYGLLLGEYCINEVGGKAEKRYASHPYMTGLIEEFEIDFVPCYRINDSR